MSEADEQVQVLVRSNARLSKQIIAVICIFMLQLFIMTISIRDFMAGEPEGLWLSSLISLALLLLSLLVLACNRLPKQK